MSYSVRGGLLTQKATEYRDRLVLTGENETLRRKLDDMLTMVCWNSAQEYRVKVLLEKAGVDLGGL